MPIWIALYRMLSSAGELYLQPFIGGWIDDLTTTDPYHVLPAVLVVTMLGACGSLRELREPAGACESLRKPARAPGWPAVRGPRHRESDSAATLDDFPCEYPCVSGLTNRWTVPSAGLSTGWPQLRVPRKRLGAGSPTARRAIVS
jgi:hypothetical protein